MKSWPEPAAGDIVWCHFPDNVHPKPKPRPALILVTKVDDEGVIFTSVAYGTSFFVGAEQLAAKNGSCVSHCPCTKASRMKISRAV